MSACALSCVVSVTSWMASAGIADCSSAARMTCASAMLERMASLPPRSSTALPDFRHSPAESAVTFGRAS